MPKIKVKNIPAATRERICDKMSLCEECPFHLGERFVIDEDTDTGCVVDSRYNPEETIVELSEKDFPTNREWIESLSDEDLARVIACTPSPTNPDLYGMPVSMVKDWLSLPCKYLMEEEE